MLGVVIAVAACGGPAGSPADSAGAPTAAASGAGASPAPSQSADAGFVGGTATARLTLPSGALSYAGGTCEHGPSDAWLAVNIGQPAGAEYFGLIAGRSPYGSTDARTASGGGTVTGAAVLITYRHAGTEYVLDQDSA